MRFIHRTGTPVTVYIPPTGAPDADATSRCTPSGMGRSPARYVESLDQLRGPVAGAGVEQAGGGGVGLLGGLRAGEPVAEQVRDQQGPHAGQVWFGGELVEGVE